MKPINFEDANYNVGGEMPINHTHDLTLSRWKATWRERLSILFYGTIWIAIRTHSVRPLFPPMLVSGNQAFEIENPPKVLDK